jgi:hypothetical protein
VSNIAQKCIGSKINVIPERTPIGSGGDESITVKGSGVAMMHASLNADFWVEVRHRHPLPKRYTWEIHRKGVCLSVEESRGQFGSWEEASQVGNKALKQFLQAS